jgi:diaminohydroxyphosphoribosylaminopyrimidine deaminase/5-amino-6-(5-phosphoribosylamino)uracil reductase
MVGCVIVADETIVGEGWHERAGSPHAEAHALAAAGEKARGATAYVTLEPCTHRGRTAPCVDALIAHGVSRVVIGSQDPSPQAGGGAKRLREAGIGVSFAEDCAAFEELNVGWFAVVRTGRPWVTAKLGMTLDGKIAAGRGVRTSVTGKGSRKVTMSLRERSDAILVGAGTARVDDPRLTVRDSEGMDAPQQPLRVVISTGASPIEPALFTDGRGPVALLIPQDVSARPAPEVRVIRYDPAGGLDSALRALGAEGVNQLLVEPGPMLFSSLWEGELLDELVTIQAGRVFGQRAPGPFTGTDLDTAACEPRLRAVECAIIGEDSVTVWRRMR